jgi:hypothetical protein
VKVMNMKEDDTVSAVALVVESDDTAADVLDDVSIASEETVAEGPGPDGNGALPTDPADEADSPEPS